jgi:osmotically-inducible protein OsmY
MKNRISSLGLPAALLSASLFAACQNTARGVEQDTERNVGEAKQEAREANAEVRQEAREANAEMKQEGREANAEIRQEAREAGNAAERAGDRVAREAGQAADRTGNAAERTGDRVAQETKDATRSVGATLDAAAQTMQIKTALIDADNLDANNIDVDTNAAAKTVTLRGHVASASQKAAAERIAKQKAPDYRVINSLVVK